MGKSFVLGLGNSVDYEVTWDTSVMTRLIAEHEITSSELHRGAPISSVRDLLISILGFLRCDTGGEQFVDSPEPIDEFAANFDTRITVGGTSLRAAIAMGKLGHSCALHLVSINDHVRRRLPQDSVWICSNDQDSVFPHLIVQFPPGACLRVGDVTLRSVRGNRIIYVNDPDNLYMKIDTRLASSLRDAKVLLISGFNAMRSAAVLADRLRSLRAAMRSLPQDAIVFYEDACFHDFSLSALVRDALLERVRIYSLNEDEWQSYLRRNVALMDPIQVHDALRELHRLIPAPILVVHTRHWALAYGAGAERFRVALRAGIIMASTRLRLGDVFNRGDYDQTARMQTQHESARFASALEELDKDNICCLPSVGISGGAKTTVGLGDAFVGGFLPALLADEPSKVMQ